MSVTKTLEQYLVADLDRGVCDHTLRATRDTQGKIGFYLYPAGKDGDTCDFLVDENILVPNPAIRSAGWPT